jgi:hypothetical protein
MDFDRLFASIDDAEVVRKQSVLDEQSRLELGHDPLFYEGRDSVTGKVKTQLGAVRSLSNVQPEMGQVGIGVGGFDVGSRRSPRDLVKRVVRGDVKLVATVDRGITREYWLGGDRKTPILIASVTKAEIVDAHFESTGAELDQWLFAVRTKVGTAYRVRLFTNTGAMQDSTSVKNGYLQYKGAGFWVSPVLESPPFVYTSSSTGSSTQIGGFVTNYISGSVFGGSISWAYPYIEFQGGRTDGATISSTTSTVVPNTTGDFDWGQQGQSSSQSSITYRWAPAPGIYEGFQYLNGAQCSPGDVGAVRVRQGKRSLTETESSSASEQSISYQIALFGGGLHELSGLKTFSSNSSRDHQSEERIGADQFYPVTCTEGPGPIVGTFLSLYVMAPPITSPSSPPDSSVTTSTAFEAQAKNQSVYVAPGVQKNNVYSYSKTVNNGVPSEATTQVSYQSILSFDNSNSYVYCQNSKVFQNSRGTEIEVFGFDFADSSVVQGITTKIYKVPTSLSDDWKKNPVEVTVDVKELSGQNYVSTDSVERKILPIKASIVGASEADIKLFAARAWA